MKISFSIPDSYKTISTTSRFRRKIRVHYLRDWSGFEVPGYILFQPLDAMYGAAYVRARNHDVQLIDGNLKHYSRKDIIGAVKAFNPDWLVLPASWRSLETDITFIKQLKEQIPGVKAAMAGPNVTLNPELVLYPGSIIDLVIMGEIEGGLRGLLSGNTEDNCCVLGEDGNIKPGTRSLIENLDEIPFPARDLVFSKAYNLPFAPQNPVTSMLISRGCPHSKCHFCNGNTYSMGTYRWRSVDHVMAEIEEIVKHYQIQGINFRDQCFTGNQDLVAEICREILNRSLKISWRASTRVDAVNKELLKLMARAGCYLISFGFESDDQGVLDTIGKGITVEQAKKTAKWAQEAGMEMSGGLMLSLSGERPNADRRLLDYARSLGMDYPQFQLTAVVPGAKLFNNDVKVRTNDDNRDSQVHFNTDPELEKEMLRKLAWLYFKFYFSPRYIISRAKKIRTISQLWQTVKTAFKVFCYPFLYKV